MNPAAGRGWEPGPATFWNVTSRGSGHPKSPQNGPWQGVSTTFGGTCPDQRKDQRTPLGVRAWGDEVGDVPPP